MSPTVQHAILLITSLIRCIFISVDAQSFSRASRAKLQRLEKRLREMEKAKDELRHTQAKCSELERMNKKLQEHTHSDRKEIIRLKEELQGFKTKVHITNAQCLFV